MAKQFASPGVNRGIQFIVERIIARIYLPASQLPDLNELAKSAGISYATMAKAMANLKSRGIVDGVRGSRSSVCKDCLTECHEILNKKINQSVPKDTRHVWNRVKDRIQTDIFNGLYNPGEPFPSIKELMARYAVSYASLKKCLNALCSQKIIVPFKRTYAVPQLTSSRANRRIIFITTGDAQRRLHWSSLNEESVRILERECSRSSIGFQPLAYLADRGLPFFEPFGQDIEEIPQDEQVIGYQYGIVAPHDAMKQVLGKLVHVKKPVAILDVTGSLEVSQVMSKPNIRLFSAAVTSKPSMLVAQYLIQLGHKKIAYISPFHNAIWSKNRIMGLEEVYSSAGISNGIVPITLKEPPLIYSHYQERALKKSSLSKLTSSYNKWKKNLDYYFGDELDPVFNFQIPFRNIPYAEFRQQMYHLFDQALKYKDVTAWVASNDEVAVAAMGYLKKLNVEVPGQISIIGFDDTSEALQRHLTSYNFNMQAIVRLMLGFVLNTRSLPFERKKKPIEVDGWIVERNTVLDRSK